MQQSKVNFVCDLLCCALPEFEMYRMCQRISKYSDCQPHCKCQGLGRYRTGPVSCADNFFRNCFVQLLTVHQYINADLTCMRLQKRSATGYRKIQGMWLPSWLQAQSLVLWASNQTSCLSRKYPLPDCTQMTQCAKCHIWV